MITTGPADLVFSTITSTSTYTSYDYSCPSGFATTTVGYVATSTVAETEVTITASPTASVYAACNSDNVATALPVGKEPIMGYDINAFNYYTYPDFWTYNVMDSAEACCNYCHSLPVCYGSE